MGRSGRHQGSLRATAKLSKSPVDLLKAAGTLADPGKDKRKPWGALERSGILVDPPGSVVHGVQRGAAARAVLGMGWQGGTSAVQSYRDGVGTAAQRALTEQHSISQPETHRSGRYRCCFSSLTKRQSWVLYVPTEGKKFLCLWALHLPRVSSGGSCGTERVRGSV